MRRLALYPSESLSLLTSSGDLGAGTLSVPALSSTLVAEVPLRALRGAVPQASAPQTPRTLCMQPRIRERGASFRGALSNSWLPRVPDHRDSLNATAAVGWTASACITSIFLSAGLLPSRQALTAESRSHTTRRWGSMRHARAALSICAAFSAPDAPPTAAAPAAAAPGPALQHQRWLVVVWLAVVSSADCLFAVAL